MDRKVFERLDVDILLSLRGDYMDAVAELQERVAALSSDIGSTGLAQKRRSALMGLRATARGGHHASFGSLFGVNQEGFSSHEAAGVVG